jgi:hypothetical protein
MAAPTIFRSSDAGAATLNGNAGSLISVLDACLVTGLGWSKAFTGTNKAVYRAPNGVRHYLDVDDSGPNGTALGRNAVVRGYEVATAVGTGTGPFPTVAQAATPNVTKSSTADGTARPWLLIGDDKTFYLFNNGTGTTPPSLATILWTGGWGFGELLSVLTGDIYRSSLIAMSNTATATSDTNGVVSAIGSSVTTSVFTFMPRSYSGAGGSIWAANMVHSASGMPYPNGPDGGLYVNASLVAERGNGTTPAAANGNPGFRGRLRGANQTAHLTSAFADQDTFSGVGDFAGKTFMIVRGPTAGNMPLAVETTAWAASS